MVDIASRIFEKVGPPSPASRAGQMFRRMGVRDTPELQRILSLPSREWSEGIGGEFGTADQLVEVLTNAFKRPGGKQRLRPVQAVALAEAHDFGGLFAPMRVGSGKTIVTFLAPAVMKSARPLLLVPAKLRDKTLREWHKAQADWILPSFRLESYEMLGRVQSAELLQQYRPDLVVADECHYLKNPKAACTRRLKRYLEETRTKFIALSGTITNRSFLDYWHLLKWSLGDRIMPLPSHWNETKEWSECLDVGADARYPGALMQLAPGEEESVEAARRGYARRLISTPGVVSTVGSQVNCSLTISQIDLPLDHLAPYFEQLRNGETPDGHPWTEKTEEWRHARELVNGFFYVWSPRPPEPWLEARKAWSKWVRGILSHSRTLDSEFEVVLACDRGELIPVIDDPIIGEVNVLAEWRKVRDTFEVNQVPVWVNDTVVDFSTEWLRQGPGIVWVEHVAFGERLAEKSGFPYYGAQGLDGHRRSIEDAEGPIIASIAANGTGRNLQRYNRNLIPSVPPNNKVLEQLIGRTHREGQEADEVTVEVVLGCKEGLDGWLKALEEARYVEESTLENQKLLYADKTVNEQGGMGPLWG